jgi:phospholipase/carboxylesterase
LAAAAGAGTAFACHRNAASPADKPPALPGTGTWGGLRARIAGSAHDPSQIVVLLHGWGAPGTDLVPLADEIGGERRLFVFPEGPLTAPGGGRAWWPIDIARLQDELARGQQRSLREESPKELEEAHEMVLALAREVAAHVRLPLSSVVLGGFSQGAMLATDVVLAGSERFGGLVVLSGSIVKEKAWQARLSALAPGLPAFMSHGQSDPVLPFRVAEDLRDKLRAASVDLTWVPFAGGHEIPWPVLSGLRAFLDARRDEAPAR